MNFYILITNITFFLLNVAKTWRTHALKKFYDLSEKNIFKLSIKLERKQLRTACINLINKRHTQSYELSLLVKRSWKFKVTFQKLYL